MTKLLLNRRLLLAAGAGVLGSAAAAVAAPNILSGRGDIRSVNLFNPRTRDRLNSVYWVEGRYIPEVMREIDHLMRDWRLDAVKSIDPGLVDIISAVHREVDSNDSIEIFSGYRSPQTNRMLRSRSRAVASNSYHIRAMAADIHMDSRSVRQLSGAAMSLGAGGVGRYSRSDFVHVDCGPTRSWGR